LHVGKPGQFGRRERQQQAEERARQHQPENAAGRRKQQRLGGELQHEPSSSGAECVPDGQLARSCGCLRHEQVRRVRARHEQQHGHGSEEDPERSAHLCRLRLPERDGRRAAQQVLVPFRRLPDDPLRDPGDIGGALRDRDPGPKPPDRVEVV
jgi:hypothetical protein